MVNVVSIVPDASVVKRKVCWNCGATLEYVPAEVQNGVDCDYTGGRDIYRFIECPNCKEEVRVGY